MSIVSKYSEVTHADKFIPLILTLKPKKMEDLNCYLNAILRLIHNIDDCIKSNFCCEKQNMVQCD